MRKRQLKRILLATAFIFLFIAIPPSVHASTTQVTPFPDRTTCANTGTCLQPFLMGAFDGEGVNFGQDSKGNLIGLVICGPSNVCNSDFATLVWSSDGGVTWSSCVTIAQSDCNTGGASTTRLARNSVGSSCIRNAAMYVSGSTVLVGYARGSSNTVSDIFIDRMNIQYSGNTITDILNNGPETDVSITTGTTPGLTCIQQILPTPNGGGEVMVFATEETSGPLDMFRTTLTSSAFSNLAGTASAFSQTIGSQNDGSDSCSVFQPSTGDIWNFDVYDRTGNTLFVNQYTRTGSNWNDIGTGGSTSTSQGAIGTVARTRTVSCTADSTNAYFAWFKCRLSGGASECANGAPAIGSTCDFELWEATPTSSAGNPTQLSSLTEGGACHASAGIGDGAGGAGTTLTSVGSQLYLTGVDDNIFGTGCTSEGGADNTKCQQLFLAKYTVSSNTWGTPTQYPGAPSAVSGAMAFAKGLNLELIYGTCNDYSGTLNTNDGGCTAGNGTNTSAQFDPIIAPNPPTITLVCNNGKVLKNGDNVVCTVTVSVSSGPTPTGTVTFSTVPSTAVFSPSNVCTLSGGSCSVNFQPNQIGNYVFTVSYSGDGNTVAGTLIVGAVVYQFPSIIVAGFMATFFALFGIDSLVQAMKSEKGSIQKLRNWVFFFVAVTVIILVLVIGGL